MTIQRAAMLYDQRRFDLAADEARRVLAANPQDATAHSLLSLALTQQEQYEEATAEAEAGIAAMPDLPLAHVAHATVLAERNRFAQARIGVTEAIRLDPGDESHYALLGNIELKNRNWKAAYEATARGLAIAADDAELLRVRSVAAAHLGQLDEAQSSSRASLSSLPDEPQALATHGYLQMHAGRFGEARQTFTNVLQLDASNALARHGLIETIRATNPLYRLILRYFLMMSRLTGRQQAFVLIGGPLVFRVLGRALNATPSTRWLVAPLIVLWFAIILSTWLAIPLSNLALMLHPLGRHALDAEERVEALIIGALLAVSLLGLAAFAAGVGAGLFLAASPAAAALPIAAAFRAEDGWPRWVLAILATSVVVTGAAAATLALIRAEGIAETSPAWIAFWTSIGIAIVSTWAAQWLMRVQPTR